MDSIKVWTTKVIILSIVGIVLVATLQIISGMTISFDLQQIVQIVTGNIMALIIVQLLYTMYMILNSKVERLWKHTLIGFLITSLLYTFIVMSILLDQVAYILLGYGPVLISIYLFVAYSATFIWLTEDRIDTFLHHNVVTTLTWFVAGGISAGALTLVVNLILVSFNISLFENPLILFGTGIVTGGLVASLSVIGRQQTLGRVGGQVTMYSNLLTRLGKKNSILLDSILQGNNQEISLNPSETREWMEYSVPWLLTFFSMTIFFIVTAIISILEPSSTANLLDPLIIIGFILYIGFITFKGFKATYGKYRGYQEWRRIWSDFWDLVKLFTMAKDATAMEYTHRVANNTLSELDLQSQDLNGKLEELMEICEMKEKIPNELEEQRTMFVNLILYIELKEMLTESGPKAELLENEMGLRGKAKSIFDGTKLLILKDIRQELAIGILYASVYDDSDIPVEMFKDIAPLLTRNWKHEPEICSQCIDQLTVLEDTPKRIIPDSLKWLPAIFPIALWVVTVLLS